MTKRILAIMLALCFVFAFAACKKDGGDNGTTTEAGTLANGETVANDETNSDTEAASGDTTAVSGDASTEAATDASGKPVVAPTQGSSNQGGGTVAASKPSTTAEIVEYFNKAANQVKTSAKSVKHHYSKITFDGDAAVIPGWADSALKIFGGADKFINDQLAKNSKGEQTYKGADIKAKFPVEGESYASKLTDKDVAKADLNEENGKYIITITTIADPKSSNVKHGQGHAPKAFNVVLPGVVNENVPGAVKSFLGGDAEMNYPSSTIKATIDIATGRLVKADYTLNWTINFGTNVVLPFTTLDSYTISY